MACKQSFALLVAILPFNDAVRDRRPLLTLVVLFGFCLPAPRYSVAHFRALLTNPVTSTKKLAATTVVANFFKSKDDWIYHRLWSNKVSLL